MKVSRVSACFVVAASTAAFLVATASPAAATGTTYWVSPSGSDAAAGTSAAPFQTIQHCATIAVAGDTCEIESGTYREAIVPANSGTSSSPITFTGAPGASVTVDGSDPVSGWTLDSGHIYKTSVTIPGSVMGLQLFQGNTSIPTARYPSTGTDLMHMNRATAGSGTTHNATTDVSTIKDTSLPGGLTGATVTFWGGYQWLAQTAVIATSNAGQLTFTGASAQCAAAPYNALCAEPGTRYYVSNAKSLMTYPGSWYYDSSAHVVYYWAPNGGVPSGVTIKRRDWAFDLSGRSYTTIENLSLFGDTITTDSHTMTDLANPGLPADCNQIPDPSFGGTHNMIDSIVAAYVSQFDKTGECNSTSDVAARLHLYNTGIVLNGSYNTLRNSTIDWSAGNGVAVLGDHNTVTNDLIHDTDYMGTYSSGVYLQGNHQTITANTMYNTGQSGMVGNYFGNGIPTGTAVDFTNNTISYNNIFDFGLLDQDGGGMYFCCTESAANGSIDHNWVHDGQQPGVLGYGGAVYQAEGGIYLDAGSQDFTVSHNVAWNDGSRAMAINGNQDPGPQSTSQNLNVYNNTFAATPTSFNAGVYYRPNLTGSLLENNIFTGSVAFNGVDDPTQSRNLASAATSNFTNATAGDLRLTRTPTASPAIDAGMVISGITDGYVGTAPDEGAYESGGDQWVPGCNLAGCVVPNDPAHSIDDVSSTLTGTWTRATNALAYAGTDTYSNTPGSTQTLTFTGTQAQVYGLLSNVGGYGTISVDGGTPVPVDFYMVNGMGDSLVYTTPLLAYGSHTIKVTVTGTHSESTYTYVAVDRITYSTTGSTSYIDDATAGIGDNSINYAGSGWFHCTVNCDASYGQTFYDGTATGDDIAGDSMYVFFTGTQVSLIGFVGSNGATTPTVSIDGGPSVPITFYAASPSLTSVYQSPVLPWGHHSLRMDVGGPTARWASFDDLVVTP